jgi:hypothetical protein
MAAESSPQQQILHALETRCKSNVAQGDFHCSCMGSGERCAQAGCKLLARQHRPKLLASKGDLQRYMAVTYETEAQKQALHDEIDDFLSRVSTMVGVTDGSKQCLQAGILKFRRKVSH